MSTLATAERNQQAAAISWRHLPGHVLLPPACVIPIDGAAVTATSFIQYGIVHPPAIARSVPHRQKEFLYGRRAAAHALAAIGIRASEIPIGASREPVWPRGIIGSITHNRHFVAAIAVVRGHYSGVGIDIESVSSGDSLQALLEIVVAPAEVDYLRTLAGPVSLATLVTLVFSAKESLFKGAFPSVGRFFDFSAARVSRVDLERKCVQLVLWETLSDDFQQADLCTIQFDFIRDDTVLTSFAW